MRARIDVDRCTGVGWCRIAAPKVFAMGDDGRSYAVDPEPYSAVLLWKAAEGCPRQAVILEDDNGTEIYPRRTTSHKPSSIVASSKRRP
jgi:ferredoxin